MSLATVLQEMTSPASRRSAVIRGATFTPLESAWNLRILASRSAVCGCRGEGPAWCRCSHSMRAWRTAAAR